MIRMSNQQAIALLHNLNDNPEMALLVKQMQDQLDNPDHDSNLVNLIVDVLSRKGSRNALPNHVVEALMDAVLTPRELSKAAALAKTYQICTNCRKELKNGEIISLWDQQPICNLCITPNLISCNVCKGAHPIHGTVTKALKKSTINTCPATKNIPEGVMEPFGEPFDEPQPLGEYREGLRLGGNRQVFAANATGPAAPEGTFIRNTEPLQRQERMWTNIAQLDPAPHRPEDGWMNALLAEGPELR